MLIGVNGTGAILCFAMMACIRRTALSAPPPLPAMTMNSTGLVGSHAAAADCSDNRAASPRARLAARIRMRVIGGLPALGLDPPGSSPRGPSRERPDGAWPFGFLALRQHAQRLLSNPDFHTPILLLAKLGRVAANRHQLAIGSDGDP